MSDSTGEGDSDRQAGRCSGGVEHSTTWKNIPFRLSFDDGSVILVAERSGFRVHASLLSRYSPTLKELFAVPRTSEAEHYDGCPVFHLSDTAEDLEYLLQLIYDPPSLLPPLNSSRQVAKPTFAKLSAYIRLGRKYEICALVEDAVRLLEAYFAANFGVREKLRKGKQDAPFTFSENPAADAADTVNIARMTGKLSLLPLALYQCCQLDPIDLMEGVKRSQNDTQVLSLSNADIALCLRAKQTLLKASARVSSSLLLNMLREPEFCKTCADRGYGALASGMEQDLTTDPLGYYLPQSPNRPMTLCRMCLREIATRVRSARKRIWRELPSYFNLEVPMSEGGESESEEEYEPDGKEGKRGKNTSRMVKRGKNTSRKEKKPSREWKNRALSDDPPVV